MSRPKTITPNSRVTHSSASIDAQQREAMIRKAAYSRAASRGFGPGRQIEDWLAAEAEVDRTLALRDLPRFCTH